MVISHFFKNDADRIKFGKAIFLILRVIGQTKYLLELLFIRRHVALKIVVATHIFKVPFHF